MSSPEATTGKRPEIAFDDSFLSQCPKGVENLKSKFDTIISQLKQLPDGDQIIEDVHKLFELQKVANSFSEITDMGQFHQKIIETCQNLDSSQVSSD